MTPLREMLKACRSKYTLYRDRYVCRFQKHYNKNQENVKHKLQSYYSEEKEAV